MLYSKTSWVKLYYVMVWYLIFLSSSNVMIWSEVMILWLDVLIDGFPLMGMILNLYKLFSWAWGYSHFKWNSIEFLAESLALVHFLNFDNLFGGVVYRFSNGLGCHMLCESLDEFWETRTHSRACDGCHVLIFSGRDMTFNHYFDEWKGEIRNSLLWAS